MTRIFLVISVVINAIFGFFLISKTSSPSPLFTVSRVIDGDTIVIDDPKSLPASREIRLMSVNAPEINLCGGPQSKAYLEELVLNKKVRLNGQLNDHYGRLLALVYVDDLLVNQAIISAGWARFTSTASVESENLKTAFAQVKTAKIGIFSSLCLQDHNPTDSKCNIKGNLREGKKTFFYPGCGNYSNVLIELDQGDQWFCTQAQAISEGYTKSANCH